MERIRPCARRCAREVACSRAENGSDASARSPEFRLLNNQLGRSHLLPCASMRWLLSLLLIPLLSRCGPGTAAEPLAQASAVDTTYGYLIIQEEAARSWGFAPGDTLSERSLEAVPSLVRQAAHSALPPLLRG